jgi:hypothetical protein
MNNEFERRYSSFEPEELVRIVNSPEEYTSDAIEAASSELRRRNIKSSDILSSSKISSVVLAKIALETNKIEDISIISGELKKRNLWENLSHSLQTGAGYSTYKVLDEILPDGIRFTEKFEGLLALQPERADTGVGNILLIILKHVAKDILAGKQEEETFLRLRDIGISHDLLLLVVEPFYRRVKSSLLKQKPAGKSYFYALFAGLLSVIVGGIGYGLFMISTNLKHNLVLIFLGVLSGLLMHFVTGGKKGVGITCMGIFSTVLSILLGNVIYAVHRNAVLPLTQFDLIWGVVGLAGVVGLSRMITTKA